MPEFRRLQRLVLQFLFSKNCKCHLKNEHHNRKKNKVVGRQLVGFVKEWMVNSTVNIDGIFETNKIF